MKKMAWIICFIGLFMAFPLINKASAQKTIELTFSIMLPSANKLTISHTEWAKEIEKRTNGRIKIATYPGGTLTPPDKCYQGVVSGISDICCSAPGYTRGRFPFFDIFDLPVGFGKGVVNTKLLNDLVKKFQPKELSDTEIMFGYTGGAGKLHTKRPVYKLEDLKGMKIRTAGLMTEIIRHLGGAPVALPMNESYDALSKGLVEGILTQCEALEGWKLAEVVKYTTDCQGVAYAGAQFIVMNKDRWNGFPPDIQKIIKELNEEWSLRTGKLFDDLDKSGLEFALKLGNKIISLSKEENERWAKAASPMLDNFVNEMKAKSLPGKRY